MFGFISSIFSGLMTGLVGPLFGWLNKKQDTELGGFQAATAEEIANYSKEVDYQLQLQQLKISANQWIGPRILYMIIGVTAAIHAAAVFIDSTFLLHWHIAQCPAPFDTYEGWIIGSLFVTSLAAAPVSAVTAWLHRK